MNETMSGPKGKKLKIKITDKRWNEEGWHKYAQTVNDIEIHYLYNERLNLYDDFHFKDEN